MSNLRKLVLGGRASKWYVISSVVSSGSMSSPDFTPTKWSKYFHSEGSINVENNSFHYYEKGDEGPILVTIHGGGYSGLTWALFAEEVTTKVQCRILSIDLRGHGNTFTDNDEDLSLPQLANDVANVINNVSAKNTQHAPIILIGHSLGGAVAVEAAPLVENLTALCVIDVVEGTALESLSSMHSILRGRPAHFNSIGHAIQWGFRGGSTHNLEAAKVSMPGQIKCATSGKVGSQIVYETDDAHLGELNLVKDTKRPKPVLTNSISEDGEDEVASATHEKATTATFLPPLPRKVSMESSDKSSLTGSCARFSWRIDLAKTESFWTGWFKGLSDKFLNIAEPKILLLANIQGLDTRLTIGQMQGRFQLQVLPKSGHAIHEDQPGKVADIISTFLVRQKLATPIAGFVPLLPGC